MRSSSLISFSKGTIASIYPGAGGAGSVALELGGNGGSGGAAGHSVGIEVNELSENITIEDIKFKNLYGAAGGAGAAGFVGQLSKGGNGGHGAIGGDSIGIKISQSAQISVRNNEFVNLYAGAGAAGAAGALGTFSFEGSGAGGNGGAGGSSIAIKGYQISDSKFLENKIRKVFGGAGATGGVGAASFISEAGAGGNSGNGGDAVGIALENSNQIEIIRNKISSIHGAAGAIGTAGSLGLLSLSKGGDAGHGGMGAGVLLLDSPIEAVENEISNITYGLGGLGNIMGSSSGEDGISEVILAK